MTSFLHLRAVMLDWAGTTVDHGSVAPVLVLQELFERHGIELTAAEARRDMGLLKQDHIRALLGMQGIRERWSAATGRAPEDSEVDLLFGEFRSLQGAVLPRHSQVIEGVVETTAGWRQRGLRLGSTTGYTREMLEPIAIQAAVEGYRPDASVCPEEAGGGRPAPWMLFRNAQMLEVYPPAACVKIGDTVSDVEEGKNAGMWTIGLTRTGNIVGLDAAAWAGLSQAEQASLLQGAEETLRGAGADFVAESVAACTGVLEEIEERLRRGESPARTKAL